MIQKTIFSILFCWLSAHIIAQSTYGVVPPDTIRNKCDNVIISEIGKKAFDANVKFIKCDSRKNVVNGEQTTSYTLFYSFGFPNVKESHVIFSLDFKITPKTSGVVKDIAFKNYTRLPASIKTKGLKIIDFASAKKIAIQSDTTLKKFQTKLFGEISTEYDEALKEYCFEWHFYYMDICKDCKTESFTTYSVFINASTGKVLHVYKNGN